MKISKIIILIIVCLTLLNYGRLWLFHNTAWDDNCWLISAYSSGNVNEFIRTGFIEMRRLPQGAFLYYFLKLHKISDYAYWIWHSVTILIKITTAVFIYFLSKRLSGERSAFAFLTAGCFLISPLDNSIPVYSNLYYRLGICLSVISVFLTCEALVKKKPLKYLLASLGLAAVSQYVLMEGAVALEPARFLLILYIISVNTRSLKRSLKKTLAIWLPFFLLSVPLIIYKLKYKPYGMYEGTYVGDPQSMFSLNTYIQPIKYLLFQSWYIFARYSPPVSMWSVISGMTAGILSFYALGRIFILGQYKESRGWLKFPILFGSILLIFPVLMYLYAGNIAAPGSNSRHGIILQFGWSILAAAFLYALFKMALSSIIRMRLYRLFLACFFGLGVFFNNVNLDLYFSGWGQESRFFQAFTGRFPSLPREAIFFIDAEAGIPFFNMENAYFYADLNNHYDFEFPLNILYAEFGQPETFRKYKVCTAAELRKRRLTGGPDDGILRRASHWGEDVFDFRKLIFIHYRKGELLVNREILSKYPDIPYRGWLDKGFPELPDASPYPLRHKFESML